MLGTRKNIIATIAVAGAIAIAAPLTTAAQASPTHATTLQRFERHVQSPQTPSQPLHHRVVHRNGRWYVFDSAQPQGVPSDASAVAGYDDGAYAWTPSDWARFPHATHITVDIVGGNRSADAEDVEPGGVPLGDVRGWADAREGMGYEPIIYCSLGNLPHVLAEMQGFHHHWVEWVAQPDNYSHIVPGSSMTQYQWTSDYDESVTSISPSAMIRHF